MKKRITTVIATAAIIGGGAAAVTPAGAAADNGNGPNCANGQFTAAVNQPSFGQFLKHYFYAQACDEGVPPGQTQ
jgi:hypothetical protein